MAVPESAPLKPERKRLRSDMKKEIKALIKAPTKRAKRSTVAAPVKESSEE